MTSALLLSSLLAVGVQEPLAHLAYRAQMAAAESALRLGDHTEARAWLDGTDPKLRGVEWRLADAEFDVASATWSVDAVVTAIATSPDGTSVACGRDDGVVELRDATTFVVRASVAAHAQAITQLRYDRVGERIVTCSLDRKVKVLDATDLRMRAEFVGHGFPVGGADFSADGALVASCSYERPDGGVVGTLHLWNAADGTLVRTLHGGRKPLVGLAFAPDGKRVAAGSWDFCAFVWDLDATVDPTPRKFAIPDEGIYNAVDGVAWSDDGARLAAASQDRTARVFDVATGALIATLRGHTDAVTKLAFAPGSDRIATTSADGTVRLWDAADGVMCATLKGHADGVVELAFDAAGERLWTCARDRTVRVFDPRSTWFGGVSMHGSHATCVVRFSPAGERLATASFDGRVTIWSTATADQLGSWQAHPTDKSCHMLDWSPDGRVLYSGSYDGTVAIWDSVTRVEIARLPHDAGLYWLAVSPDGSRLAVASQAKVHVWDLATRERSVTFGGHASSVLSVNWSADGTRCISSGRDGKALVFDAGSGAVLCTITGVGANVAEAAFVAGDTQVVVGGRSGHVALFDAASGAKVRDLVRNRHGLDHLAVSPDGSRVVLASDAVTFVDLAHGGIVGRLRPHKDRAFHVAFDRAGGRLASCSTDRSIVLHDPRPLRERLAESKRVRALRNEYLSMPAKRTPEAVFTAIDLDPTERAAWIEALTVGAAK